MEFSKKDLSKTLLSHEELSPILSNPLRIQKILGLGNELFFQGLRESYEAKICVKDAVDCLWAYCEHLLLPELSSTSMNKHIKCYVKALSSMQLELNSGNALNSLDVWYATLILILYEVRLPIVFQHRNGAD